MKFIRSKFTYFGAWFYFVIMALLVLLVSYVSYRNQGNFTAEDLKIASVLYFVLEVPFLVIAPICCQRIEIDKDRISLYFSFIKLRSIKWEDAKQVGVGKTAAGYGTYKEFIYVSNREVTSKELNSIMQVKDYRNFITFEYTEEKYNYLVSILPESREFINAN
jgi:hypothetical protein